MATQTKFASPAIAKEMEKVFGAETKTFSLKLQHKKPVGDFVRKIEKAHKNAAKSSLVFG
jgi:hypothetical protein